MKRFPFIMALLFLCFISSNFAQQSSAEKLFKVTGSVKNQDKVSLGGLNLYFEVGGERKTFAVTDENGFFTAEFPVGKFKITTNPAVSKSFAAFIEISDNNLNPTDFELIVETEKFCCDLTSNGNFTEVVKYFAPPYPPAAKALRASGEVIVKVKIGKEGNVNSAQAESGHPLLRGASEAAAKLWLFSSDENNVKREGKIVFAFVQTEKERPNVFTKPNRLVVYAEQIQIRNKISY